MLDFSLLRRTFIIQNQQIENHVHGNTDSLRMASPVWRPASWLWGVVGRERDGFLLSSDLQLLGREEDMSQREVAGVAGGRLALDNETLTLLHSFCFHHH